MSVLELVILTKSAKRGGFCVAGIDLKTRDWVRLVSENEENDGAITNGQMRDVDGSFVKPLDVVRVNVKAHAPIGCQSENYIVFSNRPWIRIGRMTFEQVLSICSTIRSKYIFGNQYKYLNEERVSEFTRSLMLVEVSEFKIYKNEFDKIKCSFKYGGYHYSDISMTDPDYYGYDNCDLGAAHIVVSLPHTDFEGRYYKFVAKIFSHTASNVAKKSLSDLLN